MDTQPQPVTLFLSVTPGSKIDSLQTLERPDDDNRFRIFIARCLLGASKMEKVPDNWLFRYDFPDAGKLPRELRRPVNELSFDTICHATARQGIRPTRIVTLREASYCQQEGIDPLSFDAETKTRIGFRPEYGLRQTESFPTCRAVDTGRGVLLYDLDHSMGREAYRSFLQHCADHFFDPEMTLERLRIYDLQRHFDFGSMEKNYEALNFDFRHHGHDFSMRELLEQPLQDYDLLREGVVRRSYDMRPMAENYSILMTREDLLLYNTHHTFSIAVLDHVARNGYPTWKLGPEWTEICPLSARFRDLSARIMSCKDPQQMESLQEQARRRAAELLEEHFPSRRKELSQEFEHATEQQIYHIPDPVPVPNRLKL